MWEQRAGARFELSLTYVEPARRLAVAARRSANPGRATASAALLPIVDIERAAKHALAAIFAAALVASLVYRLDPMGVGAAVRAHCYRLGFSGVHTVLRLNADAHPVQRPREPPMPPAATSRHAMRGANRPLRSSTWHTNGAPKCAGISSAPEPAQSSSTLRRLLRAARPSTQAKLFQSG
jgi:hypothetical protein